MFEVKETKLGDPAFNDINIHELLNDNFLKNLYKKINMNKVYKSDKLFVTSNPETVYLTVVDKDLNTVSFINSICHGFGSCITSKNTGILFQNRGVNFRIEEGHPNVIGVEKDLHTIIPGLITDEDDQSILSYGVMGNNTNLLAKVTFYKIYLIII